MLRNKKIIGFDSWLGGVDSYQRLVSPLKKIGIKLTLVHISSWGNDVNTDAESWVGNLHTRDIKYYGGRRFERVLDVEKPDAVIFTSTDTFAHRAFNRYCNERNIPTLNLYHGVRSVIDSDDDLGSPKIPLKAYIKNLLSKIGKLLRYTLPVYSLALFKTKATSSEWLRFYSDTFKLAIGRDPAYVKASRDSKTTKCAVYVQSDVGHAMTCYGLEKENIYVVGNPDFNHFGLKHDMIGNWKSDDNSLVKTIMYIETGYSSCGFYYSGTRDFIGHLESTSKSLSQQGYKILVKLKPRQLDSDEVRKALIDAKIEIVENEDFLLRLRKCSGCIAERTSLAILPALIGIPIFLVKYGPLNPVAYGKVLKSYPRSTELYDINAFSKTLRKIREKSNKSELSDWIDANAGPMPFELMPDRVVSILDEMISK